MASYMKLHEYADIKLVHPPVSADAALTSTNAAVDLPVVGGWANALFVLNVGTIANSATLDAAVQYSSAGSASDVAELSAATDAVFAQMDSDGENEVYLLDLDLLEAGISDADGVLWLAITTTAAGNSDVFFSVNAILYGGNMRLPSTAQNTVLEK
jgi:hypothetical protein